MTNLTSRLILVVLGCCIGFGAVIVLGQLQKQKIKASKIQNQASVPIQQIINQTMTFNAVTNYDGKTKDGESVSDLVYESSDGVNVTRTIIFFKSAARARANLQSEVKQAVQIIEQSPLLDTNGNKTGERAVLLYAPQPPFEARAAVAWTDKSEFYSITSTSLQHVLEFEKTSPH
jgi:hypothetical protein